MKQEDKRIKLHYDKSQFVDIRIYEENKDKTHDAVLNLRINRFSIQVKCNFRIIDDNVIAVNYWNRRYNVPAVGIRATLKIVDGNIYAIVECPEFTHELKLKFIENSKDKQIFYGSYHSKERIDEFNKSYDKKEKVQKTSYIRLNNVKTKQDIRQVKLFDARYNSRYNFWYITEFHNKEKFAQWI